MPGGTHITPDIRHKWLREEPSVFDSKIVQAIKWLTRKTGMDDPQNHAMALMAPMEVGPSGGLAGAIQKIIRAYHGSPHDFDKFSMSKIGTGEGAQAYGHGLYFAENPQTAHAYRTRLAGNVPLGMPYADTAHIAAARDLFANSYSDEATLAALRQAYPTAKTSELSLAMHQARPGRMYEVGIHADPETLLDWDKPISQQGQRVRAAIESVHDKAGPVQPVRLNDGSYSVTKVQPDGSGRVVWDVKADTPEGAMVQYRQWLQSASGGDVYHDFARANYGRELTPPQASNLFKEAGIPGIKYLDQVSRTSGEGTRNYVMFDDSLIEILRKWGLLPPIAASVLNQDQPQ